jgi:hypothetical protein
MQWLGNHVRQSQYLLQIVKCHDHSCCKPFRSSMTSTLTTRFLPTVKPFVKTELGPKSIPLLDSCSKSGGLFRQLANHDKCFDRSCPSVQKDIAGRTCSKCSSYFSSKISKKRHQQQCGRNLLVINDDCTVDDEPELLQMADNVVVPNTDSDAMPLVTDIGDFNDGYVSDDEVEY